jgi:hypothetical protein
VTTKRPPKQRPRPAHDDAAELPVILVPPPTPEEEAEAWQRLSDVIAWLVALGAQDA